MDTKQAKAAVGAVVQVVVKNQIIWGGILQYVTKDGYGGVKEGKRIDEVPLELLEIDPT